MPPQTQVNQGNRVVEATRTTVRESHQEADLRSVGTSGYKSQGLNENRGRGGGAPEPDFGTDNSFSSPGQENPKNQINWRRDVLPRIRAEQEAERREFVAQNAARQDAHRAGYQEFVAANGARNDYRLAEVNGANAVRRDLALARQAGFPVPNYYVPRPGEYREHGCLPRHRAYPVGSCYRPLGDAVSVGIHAHNGKVDAVGVVAQIGNLAVAGGYSRGRHR